MTVAALLLAAGQSRRFGRQDKLMALRHGLPLVAHAARLLVRPDIVLRFAVVASQPVAEVLRSEGFATLMLPAGQPQSASIAAGIAAVTATGAKRVLIALGDMPHLAPQDIARLLAMPPDRPASAFDEAVPMPPAIFPRDWFPRLAALAGDQGAGMLLRDLPAASRLLVPAQRLRDVDRPGDLDE